MKSILRRKSVRKILRLLSHHPERLLKSAIRRDEQLRRITCMSDLRAARLERTSPISLLAECWGRTCPNNRLRYPNRRAEAATIAAAQIVAEVEKRQPEGQGVTCVFYGSGALLQELIVLHTAALQITSGMITVIFVDPLLRLSMPSGLAGFVGQALLPATSSTEQIVVELLHMRAMQCIRWCTTAYPHIQWQWQVSDASTEVTTQTCLSFSFDTSSAPETIRVHLDANGILHVLNS